ncbi:hypothetical protein PTTG_25333 [Puccinia triticina 1-1 BBBD Race 1]|uniref:tRNA-synt_2 domain-containing protein n=1 Tax=Puccinia triticina (isolate 1-1 / race 1 (BBBD)) TaxID=630390 RepID=A0A180H3U4_PUCT1|nr:hypothetical protein PTTG_25333 [Puccinia triticina 1-1 BBBD Race 1]
MIKWAIGFLLESIVVVKGHLQAPVKDVKTCSQSKLKIKLKQIFLLAQATAKLPFLLEDASRPVNLLPKEGKQFVTVGTNTRLDNRKPVNQAIFRVQSRVCNLFLRFLDNKGFIKIYTPKIQGVATESGASVFKLGYFEQTAFLVQPPQLAK